MKDSKIENKQQVVILSVMNNNLGSQISSKKSFKNHLGGYYIGLDEFLVSILNPHVANWLKSRTYNIKNNLKVLDEKFCSADKCCESKNKNEKIILQAAHPWDNPRPYVIEEIVKKHSKNSCEKIDIEKVFKEIKDAHNQLKFAFLCKLCHNEQTKFYKNKNDDKDHGIKYIEWTLNEWENWIKNQKSNIIITAKK